MASLGESLGLRSAPNRFRFGYWSTNLLFGGIAWLAMAPFAAASAFVGGRAAGTTVAGVLTAVALALVLVAGGVAMLRIRARSFIEFDDATAQLHIHRGKHHTTVSYRSVAMALPRTPSLFPANVRCQIDGGSWLSCSMVGQGQRRTPSELRRFAEVLAQRGIRVHWA